MKTTLTRQQIDDIHAKAQKAAEGELMISSSPKTRQALTILNGRGREWAQTVLRRTLPPYSRLDRLFGPFEPELSAQDVEVLILADQAEWNQTTNGGQA